MYQLLDLSRSFLISCVQNIHSFFLPSFCSYCDRWLVFEKFLCTICRAKIKPVISKTIVINSRISIPVFSLGLYDEPLKRLIITKSWGDYKGAYQLGLLLAEQLPKQIMNYDLIIPVPLHWMRQLNRGYNQAEIIAQQIAQKIGVPMVPLVKRVKYSPYQSALPKADRKENVAHAFALADLADDYRGKRILIVDDLMTTGSTIRQLAKTLEQIKPSAIGVIVAARTN